MTNLQILLLTCALALMARAEPVEGARPNMSAALVADGAIKIDGRLDDWPEAARRAPYSLFASGADHMFPGYTIADRGPLLGPDDLSMTVRAVHDSKFLYIAGIVRDQLWFNEGTIDYPWVGDDFEIFIDANPVDEQFQKGINDNFAQIIFVPQRINEMGAGVFVSHAEKHPGLVAASRLTPLGYTIEIAIPKTVVPNWKANPGLTSIGFDVQAGDIDTPGLVGHDAGPKAILFLLYPIQHFMSADKLGNLQLDQRVSRAGGKREKVEQSLAGYARAQNMLDEFDQRDIGPKANAALRQPDLSRKAALYILMRRPELSADVKQIVAILREPAGSLGTTFMMDARVYAMVALAERHQLPAAETLERFGGSDDLQLRYTALHCLGINGDKSVVPDMVKMFGAVQHNHTHELLAVSLARLGDASGAAVLKEAGWRDRGQASATLSLQLLKQLGIDYTPHAP